MNEDFVTAQPPYEDENGATWLYNPETGEWDIPSVAVQTRYPEFELRYEEEAKDHLLKVNQWLNSMNMAQDWEAITAKPNQLFLDYDTPVGRYFKNAEPGDILPHGGDSGGGKTETVWRTMEEAYNIEAHAFTFRWTVSKSGHYHCVVTLPDHVKLSPMEAAAWQAAAGSDHKREALHMKSVVLGSSNPNILIEKRVLKDYTKGS